jgi:protein-S-isoprenylcysteine O-methyltransferase Ste14
MESLCYQLSLALVATVALGRFAGIVVLKRRQARYARQAVAYPRAWRDLCTVPEPYLLAGTTLALVLQHRVPEAMPVAALARAAAGAALALLAAVLMLWALRAFPAVSTGHYVLPEQRVVSEGPYGFVRHPLYLAAFLVWFAVAIAFASPLALAWTVLYAIPAYLIYIRSEEEMLLAHLGDAYRGYRRSVGMLLPRWRRLARPPQRLPRCAD